MTAFFRLKSQACASSARNPVGIPSTINTQIESLVFMVATLITISLNSLCRYSAASPLDLQTHQSREQGRGVKLADDCFDVAQATSHWMHRNNIPISGCSEGGKAEINQTA